MRTNKICESDNNKTNANPIIHGAVIVWDGVRTARTRHEISGRLLDRDLNSGVDGG